MKIVIWIVQIVVSLAFLAAGSMKLATPYSELVTNPTMQWVNYFSEIQVMIIGFLEVLGGIGIVLPQLIKKMQFLVPLSAAGLALTMVGGAVVHLIRDESVVVNLVLMVLALMVGWWRKDLLKKTA